MRTLMRAHVSRHPPPQRGGTAFVAGGGSGGSGGGCGGGWEGVWGGEGGGLNCRPPASITWDIFYMIEPNA